MNAQPDPSTEIKMRQQREAEFHDKCFAAGREQTRKRAVKFYSVAQGCLDYYKALLLTGAAGKDVLEYGCGPDPSTFRLAREGARTCGIDISPTAIEQSAELARRLGLDGTDLRVMDAEALDFADDSFDLVCGLGILHHLNLSRAYAEIARVLRPGGQAIFLEPLGHNPLINLYRWITPRIRTVDEHPLLMADLEMARAYFEKIETRFFNVATLVAFPVRNLPGFRAVVALLERMDRAAFRFLPFTRKYAWNVVLTLSGPKRAPAALPPDRA